MNSLRIRHLMLRVTGITLLGLIILGVGWAAGTKWGTAWMWKGSHQEQGQFTLDGRPVPPGPSYFWGKVVDQDGQPVAGAAVFAVAMPLVQADIPEAWGSIRPDKSKAVTRNVFTDQLGRFGIYVPVDYQQVDIRDIRKEGYTWVHDWVWSSGVQGVERLNNKTFTLEGPLPVPLRYKPDNENPAIFPMYRDDHPGPVTRPSRGGSDRDPSGRGSAPKVMTRP